MKTQRTWPLPTLRQTGISLRHPSFFQRVARAFSVIVQELCESRGGRPGLSVLTSFLASVDVKIIEACFGIGLSLSLICQLTSEDIKHHFIIIVSVFGRQMQGEISTVQRATVTHFLGTAAYVAVAPTPVGFQCVSPNWDGLSCTWTLDSGTSDPPNATVTYSYLCL